MDRGFGPILRCAYSHRQSWKIDHFPFSVEVARSAISRISMTLSTEPLPHGAVKCRGMKSTLVITGQLACGESSTCSSRRLESRRKLQRCRKSRVRCASPVRTLQRLASSSDTHRGYRLNKASSSLSSGTHSAVKRVERCTLTRSVREEWDRSIF